MNATAYITNPGYVTRPTSVTYYIDGRGPRRTDATFKTDLSLVWSKPIAGHVEVFFRGLVYNVFNSLGVQSVDTTVSSNVSPGSYTAVGIVESTKGPPRQVGRRGQAVPS